MKITTNSKAKPQNWIWKVSISKAENDKLISELAAFSGEKLRHGEYRVIVNKGEIESVVCFHSTVVEVEDGETPKEKKAEKELAKDLGV